MIASAEDVAEERKIVTGAIYRWNDAHASMRRLVLLPIKWETDTTLPVGVSAQTVINRRRLDDADIVIGIFGTPTGTPNEGFISDSVEEIKKHVTTGKTAKVYFSEVPGVQRNVDQNRYALLQRFREELNGSGLSSIYESMQQFRDDFEHHLALEMNQPRYRWLEVPDRTARDTQPKAPTSRQPAASPKAPAAPKAPTSRQPAASPKAPVSPKAPASPQVPALDEFQKTQADELLRSVSCVQRDLLRFLLLKGGSARADVIARARTTKNPLDMNSLCGPLELKGLLNRTADRENGSSTLAVNERMSDVLRESLLPRDEDDPPFFEGI
jgi:hypothetical protein